MQGRTARPAGDDQQRRPSATTRFSNWTRAGGAAVTAAAAWQALRLGRRLGRELREYREHERRLRGVWTALPAGDGAAPLRVHARVSDTAAADGTPPVVLVHGYGVSSAYFVPLAGRLVAEARVYAPDLPGHGPSSRARHPLTVPEFAGALAAWMDAWAIRGAVLVGQSMGCQIAAELAGRRPELVAGLVLIGPTADPAARTPRQQVGRGLRSAPFERPSLNVCAALDYSRAGPRLVIREMEHLVTHRIEDVLPGVSVPTLVVRGEHDHVAPQGWAEQVAWLARAPRPVVIPGWGHAAHYSAADDVAQHVRDFVRALPGATR